MAGPLPGPGRPGAQQNLDRKAEAQPFLAETETAQHRGGWVDLARGDTSFADWSRKWLQTKRSIKP